MIRRILGRKITIPLGARRIGIPIMLMALLLCCCGPLTLVMVDGGLRSAGLLPTYTPAPTATVRPTRTPLPTETAVLTVTPEPTAVPGTATSAPTKSQPATEVAPTKIPQRAAPTVVIAPAASAGDQGYTCDKCIKGNINSDGNKLYHFPGCPSYEVTKINEGQGERLFSSESEARAAGWSKANNCP